MSQITRCPNCKTMFRVAPDQLRIAEGWVRCGQCEEVFNATVAIQAMMAEIEAPAPASEPAPAPETEHPIEAVEHEASAQASSLVSAPSDLPMQGEHSVEADRIEPIFDDHAHANHAPASPHDELPPEAPHQAVHISDDVPPVATPVTAALAIPALAIPAPSEAPVASFMQGTAAPSRWNHPVVRVGLILVALLLSLTLGVQVVLHERDRIAATAPELKPLVQTLCEVMQCAVAPLRQIESITMDSSAFNKIRNDTYRLNFTLKNTAPIALAWPAIELSLTDAQDQPLMRRVISPAELGIKSDVLAPTSESSASLTLTVKAQGGTDRITGYRVLAFYP